MNNQDTLCFGNYYHVTNRGNHKEALFRRDQHYFYFLDLIKKYIIPIADLYTYCLLPTHFHLLVQIKGIDQIGRIYPDLGLIWKQFWTFLGIYTKTINEIYHWTGSLFEGRYSFKKVPMDEYFFQLIVSIHQNPQNYGIVSDFRYRLFSPYDAYIRKDKRSILARRLFSDDDLYNTIVGRHHSKPSLINLAYGI